jgi:hypothetical protein
MEVEGGSRKQHLPTVGRFGATIVGSRINKRFSRERKVEGNFPPGGSICLSPY